MADVTLEINAPEANVTKVAESFIEASGEKVMVRYGVGVITVDMPDRGPTEGIKEFVERSSKGVLVGLVQAIDQSAKVIARNAAVAAVPSALTDVADDIMT